MWIVEVNLLGRRFTREVGHSVPRFAARQMSPRHVHAKLTGLWRPRDAA